MVHGQTFKGGFHVHDYKDLSSGKEVSIIKAPSIVKIPLVQHIGAPATSLVKKGDEVKVGQKIGESGGFISANIHSSVSGTVVDVVETATMRGRHIETVIIENDGLDTLGYEVLNRDWKGLSKDELVHIVKEAGITGLGGASFPTHVKVNPPIGVIDSVIINAAECEPYLTADDTLIRKSPEKIVEGLLIIMKTVYAKDGYITIEDNKPEAIEALKPICEANNITLKVVKTKYPQGDEKRIIDVTLNRVVPSGRIPADIGVVVNNASTAFAIYEAVVNGKPLYERMATFTGHGMNNPINAIVRVGTSFQEAVDQVGGLNEEAAKIIIGGPMMGNATYSLDMPFEKSHNGCLAMTKKEAQMEETTPCIKCNKCVDVCPVRLVPFKLEAAVEFHHVDMMKEYHIMDCIECGSCSFVCPAKRPLVESIRIGKNQIRLENK